MKLCAYLALAFCARAVTGFEYTDSNDDDKPIPNGGSVISTINVKEGTICDITDVNVIVAIDHEAAGDLEITLTSPDGTVVKLLNSNENEYSNLVSTNPITFDDDSTNDPKDLGAAETSQDDIPATTVFSAGSPKLDNLTNPDEIKDGKGDWVLTVKDTRVEEPAGTLRKFTLVLKGKLCKKYCDDVAKNIPDPGTATSTITVPEKEICDITDVDVIVAIDHPAVGDLEITLKSPDGTIVKLLNRNNDQSNLKSTNPITFDDDSNDNPQNLGQGQGVNQDIPATTVFSVGNPKLTDLNGLADAGGDWILTVKDNVGDTLPAATLQKFCLVLKGEECPKAPTDSPSTIPTASPTFLPTAAPSISTTTPPTQDPSTSTSPTIVPSAFPTSPPSTSISPTETPSELPTDVPSDVPSDLPSDIPSALPTEPPSTSVSPTDGPSTSISPTGASTNSPTEMLSELPTATPSTLPTDTPSAPPSPQPTGDKECPGVDPTPKECFVGCPTGARAGGSLTGEKLKFFFVFVPKADSYCFDLRERVTINAKENTCNIKLKPGIKTDSTLCCDKDTTDDSLRHYEIPKKTPCPCITKTTQELLCKEKDSDDEYKIFQTYQVNFKRDANGSASVDFTPKEDDAIEMKQVNPFDELSDAVCLGEEDPTKPALPSTLPSVFPSKSPTAFPTHPHTISMKKKDSKAKSQSKSKKDKKKSDKRTKEKSKTKSKSKSKKNKKKNHETSIRGKKDGDGNDKS